MSAPRPPSALPGEPPRDAWLVSRAAGGDVEAFRALVVRHQGPVLALVRNLVGDAAESEDIAQDAFVAAWGSLASFDPARGAFFTWLARIARNRALNALARRRPRPVAEVPERAGTVRVEQGLADADTRRILDAALAALPVDQRTAFVLAHIHELPLAEVAAIEGVPIGTVKSRTARAREALRSAITREEIQP